MVATTVVLVVGNSSGWPRTKDSFFDFGTGWHDVPQLLRALWINVQIMLISEACILVLQPSPSRSCARCAGRRSSRSASSCTLYVDLFRGLPFLLVLYLVGFGIPSLRLEGGPTEPKTLRHGA